jgi:polysaccharide biosynthesis protein PslH
MNILFLTQVLPFPLDAGPKVRAYHVLQYLAQHHSVTLVSFTRPTDTPEAIAHLRTICHSVHCLPMPRSRLRDTLHMAKSLLTRDSFIINRDWIPAMTDLLGDLLRGDTQFDAIHADQLWMAPYALWARRAIAERQSVLHHLPLLVLDQHNAVHLIPQRMAYHQSNPLMRMLLNLEARKLANFEVQTCLRFERVTWVTEEDYEAVQLHAHPCTVQVPKSAVIPICIDLGCGSVIHRTRNMHRVTFMGGLHYPPNADGILWFAKEVFPEVLHAVLTIIGKSPPPQLQRLGIPAHNLDVTGYVDDPELYLSETAVMIVPLHSGGGMRVKILEAWRKGLPVVSTSVGAEGFHIAAGENILIADSPTAFAQATVDLLQDHTLARMIADNGWQSVLERYNWCDRYKAWNAVYQG